MQKESVQMEKVLKEELSGIPPEEAEKESIIKERERRASEARSLNLLSNTFMMVALDDKAACQHVLRVITGISDLEVVEIRKQYRVAKLASHDAILDILAEDKEKRLYSVEIQRSDTIDHARRTRFYGAMIDSEYLEKGSNYDELPEVYILYISEKDLWKAGKTMYEVEKHFEGTDIKYDDGMHVTYINAEVDDGTEIAGMMKYFKETDPQDMSQGELSKRVHFLKCEAGGYEIMCEMSEKWVAEGIQKGDLERARKTALTMLRRGISMQEVAEILEFPEKTIQEWEKEACEPV